MDALHSDTAAAAAIARVEQQIADAQRAAERAKTFQAEVEAVRGTATSPRRDVTVVVDASGRLLDLQLAERAGDLHPRDLARVILETSAKARVAAGQQATEIAAQAFGEDSGVVAKLREEIERNAPSDSSGIAYS